MMHFVRVMLLLTVFLTPLLPATSFFGYEQIKVLFFIAGISLASIFWLKERKKEHGSLITLAGGIFIGILAITSITGIDPKISFLGFPPYFQGLILYAYLFLFFILVRNSKIKSDTWVKVLVASASVISFIAIRQWMEINLLGFSLPTYAGRVVSTFGQPNFYSGFILMVLPFILVRKWWWVSLLLILGILISQSRISIVLMFGLLVFWFVKKIWSKRGIFNLLIIVFVLIFALFVLENVWQEISRQELIQASDSQWLFQNSPEKRVFIYPITLNLIQKSPILGYGLENIRMSFSNFFKGVNFNTNNNPVYLSLKDVVVDRSHNYVLDLLLFSGILGLLGWLGVVGLMLKKARGVMLISLILYLIWTAFQNQSIVHLMYFWLLAGLVDDDGMFP